MNDLIEPAESSPQPLPSAGLQLRAAREQAGWSVEHLAAELCLPSARLRALEADDHASFGGAVFVRGYLRRAAGVLGISPREMLDAVARTSPPGPEAPARGAAFQPPPRRAGWPTPLAGVLVLAALLAGSWAYLGTGEDPRRTAEPEPAAGLQFVAPVATDTTFADRTFAHPAERDRPAPVSEAPDVAPAGASDSLAALEAPDPGPTLADTNGAVPPGTAELRFEFTDDCWLEVADADDRRLAYRLYRSGDVARLRGKAPLTIFLGNAPGVRLTVDGTPIAVRPAAGRDGTARLTVGGGAG
jgi:cytoskeleton protein RodZ